MAADMTQMTLTLPGDLLEAVDRAVREGKARSRNDFVAAALQRALAAAHTAGIDAAFAAMADDDDYQAEARALVEEFATADWEALQLGESRR